MICVVVVVAGAAASSPAQAASPEPVRPAGATSPLGTERLSDERTLTRWAHSAALSTIRAHPSTDAPRVGRLRARTEDRLPEVYLALRSFLAEDGRIWVKVRVPGRPNGRRGWVPRESLSDFRIVRTRLLISRRTLRATLYERGRPIWRSRVGIGAPGTPTPRGSFYVRERLRNLGGGGIYGPWAFGTSAYSVLSDWPGGGVVGIHGTNQPELIPGRPSHGCVRVPNAAIRRLARLMPVGTPVRIA
ncbi:MAG: hypothetical protein AVDCRST_MAG85-902 [uncultured Solirubrobacteraceae bacterium]|uniref:L,D-TPase catalytic domain-containing protein n=1 Tax=uncultured Solirubrobacteraceae bacterium TaxID=1162706 RepID=A0A6J4RYH4_9ACTN|nr:MAG: hypothetical protein AVDCRST_MAG85-902 [uncultured Solirubrobacteraceae bacterium]